MNRDVSCDVQFRLYKCNYCFHPIKCRVPIRIKILLFPVDFYMYELKKKYRYPVTDMLVFVVLRIVNENDRGNNN